MLKKQIEALTPVIGVSPAPTKSVDYVDDVLFLFVEDDQDLMSYIDNGDSLKYVSYSLKTRAMLLGFLAVYFSSDSSAIYGEKYMVYESFKVQDRVFTQLSEEAIELILGRSKEFHDFIAKHLMPMDDPEKQGNNRLGIVLNKRKDLPQGYQYPTHVSFRDSAVICPDCPNLEHYPCTPDEEWE